ncbi:DUF6274 family protein [Streptomyces tritici]|uniref:DUF6274 family protein n=1 Tax=Streptomyces tritici TaxID=2054410 RepID=UPI003AF01FE6
MAAAATVRHETGALLRAHLAAASRYGHVTRTCPVCHRLQRLAMEAEEPAGQEAGQEAGEGSGDDPAADGDGGEDPVPQCDASH